MSRWKSHIASSNNGSSRKIHVAMREHGIEQCRYEIVESGFDSISKLAIAEIRYIDENKTFTDGLNSSPGGDGIGRHDLAQLSTDDILLIKQALGNHWKSFNKKKWADTTPEQRSQMMSHLYNSEIIEKRIKTQKEYYNSVPDSIQKHTKGLADWRKNNPEKMKENAKFNGLSGATAVSKQVVVEREDGTIEEYKSISEFQRKTKQWMNVIKEKSMKNQFHNGYKLKEIRE